MTQITVENHIAKPRDHVWTYYTKPEHIVGWNFASDDWHCPAASNDLRVGGKLQSCMEAKDGSVGFDFEGIYDEIIEGEKLAFHLEDGRRVIVTFADEEVGTYVTVVFDPEQENSLEMQREGWQAILDNFKTYAQKQDDK